VQIIVEKFCKSQKRCFREKTLGGSTWRSGYDAGKRITLFPHLKGAHAVYYHHCFVIQLNLNASACVMRAFYLLFAASAPASVSIKSIDHTFYHNSRGTNKLIKMFSNVNFQLSYRQVIKRPCQYFYLHPANNLTRI